MKLHEELYFEISVEGPKQDVRKFISYLTSGELDDFFEFDSDFVVYGDNYLSAGELEKTFVSIANDDYGIEIDELNPEKFLDAFCSGGKNLYIHGHLYDIDDEEYRFVSEYGDPCYVNQASVKYSDELDIEAEREERDSGGYDDEDE